MPRGRDHPLTSTAVLRLRCRVNRVADRLRLAEIQGSPLHINERPVRDEVPVCCNNSGRLDLRNVPTQVLRPVVRLEVPELVRAQHDWRLLRRNCGDRCVEDGGVAEGVSHLGPGSVRLDADER